MKMIKNHKPWVKGKVQNRVCQFDTEFSRPAENKIQTLTTKARLTAC